MSGQHSASCHSEITLSQSLFKICCWVACLSCSIPVMSTFSYHIWQNRSFPGGGSWIPCLLPVYKASSLYWTWYFDVPFYFLFYFLWIFKITYLEGQFLQKWRNTVTFWTLAWARFQGLPICDSRITKLWPFKKVALFTQYWGSVCFTNFFFNFGRLSVLFLWLVWAEVTQDAPNGR